MTVLSGQTIRNLDIFQPFVERSRHAKSGTSYGLSCAGYDVRIAQAVLLRPGAFSLASTVEHFTMPSNVLGRVHDKSTLARMGLCVQNTVIEPGWCGHLTLELRNNHPPYEPDWEDLMSVLSCGEDYEKSILRYDMKNERDAYDAAHTITLLAGQPIAQIVLDLTDRPVEKPYVGRYQYQPAEPVPARRLTGEETVF